MTPTDGAPVDYTPEPSVPQPVDGIQPLTAVSEQPVLPSELTQPSQSAEPAPPSVEMSPQPTVPESLPLESPQPVEVGESLPVTSEIVTQPVEPVNVQAESVQPSVSPTEPKVVIEPPQPVTRRDKVLVIKKAETVENPKHSDDSVAQALENLIGKER